MTSQTFDAGPIAPVPAEASDASLTPEPDASSEAETPPRARLSRWIVAAIVLAALAAAGAFAYGELHRSQAKSSLYAPATVPLAVAGAQVDAAKAKAASDAAHRAAAAAARAKPAPRPAPAAPLITPPDPAPALVQP